MGRSVDRHDPATSTQSLNWHKGSRIRTPDPVEFKRTKRNEPMLYFSVICPSAPWENDTVESDRAWDLCFDLSEEYGYAEVRQNGMVIGSYGNA